MEFLIGLLDISKSINPSLETIRSDKFIIESPLKNINTQLKYFENRHLSSTTSYNDNKLLYNNISICLGKIIFYLYLIFQDKLRNDNEEGISFWNYIIKKFKNSNSVKFTTIFFENNTKNEKSLVWLCLIVLEKKLYEYLIILYKSEFHMRNYLDDSIISKNKEELTKISQKLLKITFNYDIKLYRDYLKFCTNNESNEITDPEFKIIINKVNNQKESVNYNNQTNINSLKHSLISNIPYNNLNNSYQNKCGSFQGKDDNLIIEMIKEKNESDEPVMYSPTSDESFYNLENEIDYLIKKYEINQMNINRKEINNDIIQINKNVCKILDKRDFNIFSFYELNNQIVKDDYYNFENKQIIKENFLSRQNIGVLHENKFKIFIKTDKSKFTKKDIIYLNNKEIRMTNSVIFYFNHFYRKNEYFKFLKINEKSTSVESQNNQCQFCFKKFTICLGIPSNVFWCTYFFKFVCQSCISNEFSVIPSFVLKHWNFDKFPVSKLAREILDKWYDKKVIKIKNNDPVLQQAFLLREVIILKRKIHKIFDLMLCNKAEDFVIKTLKEDKYLVLKQNLFSLKDLCEINDYRLINRLKSYLIKFENHILKECDNCLYKGGTCKICMKNEVIFAYNVEDIFYCEDCKNVFHRICCSVHPCVINR